MLKVSLSVALFAYAAFFTFVGKYELIVHRAPYSVL